MKAIHIDMVIHAEEGIITEDKMIDLAEAFTELLDEYKLVGGGGFKLIDE